MTSAAPQVEVRRSARRKRTVTAYRDQGTIVVLVPSSLSRADEQRCVTDLVAKVLSREARTAAPQGDEVLGRRAEVLRRHYLTPQVVELRPLVSVVWVTNQNHRWGSCTPASGTIRLSHRLQTMPAWVLDYVLLHELTHLAEPSHSPRFHSLVDGYPAAERAKGYLEGFLAGSGAPGDAALDTADDVN